MEIGGTIMDTYMLSNFTASFGRDRELVNVSLS
jgi:hypothetical protein